MLVSQNRLYSLHSIEDKLSLKQIVTVPTRPASSMLIGHVYRVSRVDCKRNSVCNVHCNATSVSGSVVMDEKVNWDEEFIIRDVFIKPGFTDGNLCGDFGKSPEVLDGHISR